MEKILLILKILKCFEFGTYRQNDVSFSISIDHIPDSMGTYDLSRKLFTVNTKAFQNDFVLVFTVIHEYVHILQHHNITGFKICYNIDSLRHGYENNRYEIEANQYANKYVRACLNALK